MKERVDRRVSLPRALRRAARRELSGRLGTTLAALITAEADAAYPEIADRLPPAGPGAAHLLRTGAYAAALQRALVNHQFEPDVANSLVSDAVFASIRRPRGFLDLLGRLRHRDRLRSAVWTSRLAQRLYYSPPDWQMEEVPVEGGYGLDVTRCVVAEFFESIGMSELCNVAICAQDIRSAARHGLILERTGTLTTGADRCDFRYHVAPF